jgi:hypothetical protein
MKRIEAIDAKEVQKMLPEELMQLLKEFRKLN